ncbi:protein abnormal spindle [Maniola jurtina]|uniref:protein abnormal spindle n=1 Tax=Maniola jurtina TaxID=191418 RepID=UPI001E68D902|nr:protein abnormal spindle [Maniola jurtina]XP_045771520.1 protein abnormal spindle [Maniola jurtina]
MYFEIENTPEIVKRTRKKDIVHKGVPEELPRLILAPFSKPPQVVFENVIVGTTCEKKLEVLNPSKQSQQLSLSKSLPPGLIIDLPECLEVEPETCYCVTMQWTPTQLVSQRETIRFTNDNRGRHDIIVVMKSLLPTKSKNLPKYKTSPGKNKKKPAKKKSPVAIYKKKWEAIHSTVTVHTVDIVKSTQYKVGSAMNKENNYPADYSMDTNNYRKCPFDSQSSLDFNTSEIFSNVVRPKPVISHDTYNKSSSTFGAEKSQPIPNNVLKPLNKQAREASLSDVFDNITFTPLKSDIAQRVPSKNEKLEIGPKIIISVNSESDFDDSVDIKSSNKENKSHSTIFVTSPQQNIKWLATDNLAHNAQYIESPVMTNKKIPNTSSPTDMNSPNFSINTDVSRISELSFFPQRFSTERKILPKINNETHEIVDDSHNMNSKLSSDTYTKDSPLTPLDYRVNKNCSEFQNCPPVAKEAYPKMCRQSLFKEQQNFRELNERNYLAMPDLYPWHNDLRADVRSPPRSLTPPLRSIPQESLPLQPILEESVQFSETKFLDRVDKHAETFTFDLTFDRPNNLSSVSMSQPSTWSKRDVRAEPALWKTPAPMVKKPTKRRATISNKELLSNKKNRTIETNSSYVNYVGNVYSQSSTVDPFLSSTYYYDKEAVANFEKEFKRWLNYVLTPPADLNSNVEQKIDVGKAWIENRNKEVPLAPTTEKVCSTYHDSHRLESLRRSARVLLRSPENTQVFDKLQAQIEKKLIAIRSDKNLHLDIGLQKLILEIILSYNPLWLRIGLEAIYGVVLPLKSNNDIEGLTTFIIQRMFKNPFLKNKNSKSSAPNMLLPAYMEAIKKFTLKKFFILVFFLDQAKQKKLIPHDPCLFRRNALHKDSKAILINFTKELIAGIGDITKHLRPLGYVVSHKQSYLDEYIYAVNNIAVDLRDGVRLTKVMEIILMRSGLLYQLRTPAISRLQKIHNVQVALNALKDANFAISGDISAADIADGHREKTLSLLWQLIHVLRAPLFEKSANVIQIWWRKKYEVIVQKRKEEEKLLERRNKAASTIQYWWRRIQYNRMVEHQMYKMTTAAIILQKYWRMWLCRTRFRKLKSSANTISEWLKCVKLKRQAIEALQILRSQREELRRKSATLIQAHFRRWLCVKRYKTTKRKVILIQSVVRRFLAQKQYCRLKRAVTLIQRKYRGKVLIRKVMQNFAAKRSSAILIQNYYRMSKQRKYYKQLKKSVLTLEKYYISLIMMRRDMMYYLKLKETTIKLQACYRRNKVRTEYLRQRNIILKLQRKIRANQAMKKDRANYLKIRNAAVVIQNHMRAYQAMKLERAKYVLQRNAAILIQRHFRAYLQKKIQRSQYLLLRKSVILVQTRYRSLLAMRRERNAYLALRNSVLILQRRYRAKILMREALYKYHELQKAALIIQRRFRALLKMREERLKYIKLKSACITIQKAFRAHLEGKKQRQIYLKQKEAAIRIQRWFRSSKKTQEVKQWYLKTKQACTTIQQRFRALMAMRVERSSFLQKRSAAIVIQRRFRARRMMLQERAKYTKTVDACMIIQQFFRACLIGKKQRETYMRIRFAAIIIQKRWREYKKMKAERNSYIQLRTATIFIQRCIRAKNEARMMAKKLAVNKIETWYKSNQQRNECRSKFVNIRTKVITLQRKFRAYVCRKRFRAVVQEHRAVMQKRREEAAICIQKNVRRYLAQSRYKRFREKLIFVQTLWRNKLITRLIRCEFLQKRRLILKLQAALRGYLARKEFKTKKEKLLQLKEEQRRNWAASKIQALFVGNMVRSRAGERAAALRHRWRGGALQSRQKTLRERNQEALRVIFQMPDIDSVIRAFKIVQYLTKVLPMMYNSNAPSIVRHLYLYISVLNRSISSVEVMKLGADVLANLARYRLTGPKIYAREHITQTLRIMFRFSNSETQLFCTLCTYIWLFTKYEAVKQDLTEFLHMPENHKMLVTIKGNVDRMKKMENNRTTLKSSSMNKSLQNRCNCTVLPALDPDYGIVRKNMPQYFEDPQIAINSLFEAYGL